MPWWPNRAKLSVKSTQVALRHLVDIRENTGPRGLAADSLFIIYFSKTGICLAPRELPSCPLFFLLLNLQDKIAWFTLFLCTTHSSKEPNSVYGFLSNISPLGRKKKAKQNTCTRWICSWICWIRHSCLKQSFVTLCYLCNPVISCVMCHFLEHLLIGH